MRRSPHRILLLALSLFILGTSARSWAQEPAVPSSGHAGGELAPYETTEHRERALEQATKRVRRAGAGLAVSIIAFPIGVGLMVSGIQRNFCVLGSCPVDQRGHIMTAVGTALTVGGIVGITRSEERRVGKEGRSRWSPYP